MTILSFYGKLYKYNCKYSSILYIFSICYDVDECVYIGDTFIEGFQCNDVQLWFI